MSINKWIFLFGAFTAYCICVFVADLYSIVALRQFSVEMIIDSLMLFATVILLDDAIDFKKTIEKRSV